jgi:hypothetical protein
MGLTLLAHASMPMKYWDEAFLAATFLINRTPTKILSYDTPLHKLLGTNPDYSSFHVFGCACWPNLHPYNSHKLQLRSTHCVFLGYNNMHKGFKCRIYVFRDVIFDESIFPFASLHSTAGARYHSDILLDPPTTLGDNTFTNVTNVSTLLFVLAFDSCVELPAPLLQDAGLGPVVGVLPSSPPPRDQQQMVPDLLEAPASQYLATGPDSCVSLDGASVPVQPIIGTQRTPSAHESSSVMNPPGASCPPINAVMGPLDAFVPIGDHGMTTTTLVSGLLAHLLRSLCHLQYQVAQADPPWS